MVTSGRAEAHPIPCFINPAAGTARVVIAAVEADKRFEVRECEPDALAPAIEEAVEQQVSPRIAVAGGDGTLAAAANVLIGGNVELAIVPGGTLNHFATSLEIPDDVPQALEVAATGTVRAVSVGSVNDRVFLNTSSVGAYVGFVQVRDYLERWLGYHLATLVAALRVVARMPTYEVGLDVGDRRRNYRTPLAFIGVGERELRFPSFGERVDGGQTALHTLVVHGKRRGRLFGLALAAAAYGLHYAARAPEMESYFIDRCTVELPWNRALVAIDGELVPFETPLRYRLLRDALPIVVPRPPSQ